MRYIKVLWKHELVDDPVLLYSELDDDNWETRKVEVFRDDQLGYAGPDSNTESTGLGLEPVPPLAEINSIPEFEGILISREEFEDVWRKATDNAVRT